MDEVELTEAQIAFHQAIIEGWQLRASEGHCPDEHCASRLRVLRDDEVAWLNRFSGHRSRAYARCTGCAAFIYRDESGEVTGYSWMADAPSVVDFDVRLVSS